jgi:hypothetical protein
MDLVARVALPALRIVKVAANMAAHLAVVLVVVAALVVLVELAAALQVCMELEEMLRPQLAAPETLDTLQQLAMAPSGGRMGLAAAQMHPQAPRVIMVQAVRVAMVERAAQEARHRLPAAVAVAEAPAQAAANKASWSSHTRQIMLAKMYVP